MWVWVLPSRWFATSKPAAMNLIMYQAALASYAKRDEQIRTIGSLIKKLVG